MSFSKLHVRFIQSQNFFYLSQGTAIQSKQLPISQLYVKDPQSCYLLITQEPLVTQEDVSIEFKEKTHALNTLNCQCKTTILAEGSEELEDALLFFHIDESNVKQVIYLQIDALK